MGTKIGPKINPYLNTGTLYIEHGGEEERKWKHWRPQKPCKSYIMDCCLRMGWGKPIAKMKDFKPNGNVSNKIIIHSDIRRRDVRNLDLSNSFIMNSQFNDCYLLNANFFNTFLDH